jgi:hypothetical protein
MMSPHAPTTDGSLSAQITKAAVGVLREASTPVEGRRKAFLNENLVHVLHEDTIYRGAPADQERRTAHLSRASTRPSPARALRRPRRDGRAVVEPVGGVEEDSRLSSARSTRSDASSEG